MTDLVPTREQPTQIVHRTSGRPPAGGPQPSGGMTGRDLLQILRRRKWMIGLAVLICLALTTIGTLLWQFYAPLYTATALLGVSAPKVSDLDPHIMRGSPQYLERLTADAARMAARHEVLDKAASDRRLQYTPALQQTSFFQNNKGDIVSALEENITIHPVPDENFIRLSMTGGNAEECAVIVNAVALAAEEDGKDRTIRRHEQDIANLQTRLGQQQEELRELRETQGDAPPAGESARLLQLQRQQTMLEYNMRELNRQIAEARSEKEAADAAKLVAQQYTPEQFAELPEVQFAAENDPIVRSLRSQLSQLRAELENARRKFHDEHLVVKNLQTRRDSISEQLRARVLEVAQMLRQDRLTAPDSYAQQLEQLIRQRQQLETEATGIEDQLAAEAQRLEQERAEWETAYERASVEQHAVRDRINRIQNRLLELQLLAQGDPPLNVSSYARTPKTYSWPKWEVMLPLGFLVGLLIGVGMAVLVELIDTSIKNPADVSRRVDLPLLGMVPHTEDLDDEIADMRLAFIESRESLVDEAFRQIRTGLLFSGPASERRSLLITSPLPGDGRSTVTLNLAASIARSGRKVLVVDANFRQPCISDTFDNCPTDGLSSALVGRAAWQENVHPVEENFDVLPAGPLPPNPAELLGSDTMRTVIGEMQQAYDQVLFDGSPCVVITDAQVLSTQVDGVILVVRAGANTYGLVQRTRDMVERVGAHIVGAVLNGVRVTSGGYLRRNYETYYQYQQRPAELSES
ncbi:MAG: polysaccharide biosynthesis tyrosine autokinase [Phycisphaerae bacterium]|nr:polysaccharide biosynthesis tyrosine autokinase [Phycisphaerae bacterium]